VYGPLGFGNVSGTGRENFSQYGAIAPLGFILGERPRAFLHTILGGARERSPTIQAKLLTGGINVRGHAVPGPASRGACLFSGRAGAIVVGARGLA
jgi:hypothetical protein